MEIKEKYIRRYMEMALAAQIKDEYREKGYHVETEKPIGNFRLDIYAEKGDDKQMVEISTGFLHKERFERLHRFAQEHGMKFKVAIMPKGAFKRADVEIDFLEEKLCEYLNNNLPSEIDELGTHNRVEDIGDIEISVLTMSERNVELSGSCTCEAFISYDNEGDTDFTMSFPMTFNLTLKMVESEWEIDDDDFECKIDTSEFYE